MKTGSRGTFIISWSQTEVDGLTGASVRSIEIGTTWRWTGNPIRVDSPTDVYVLENAIDLDDLHRRAAKNALRMIGSAHLRPTVEDANTDDEKLFQAGFDLTDGRELYRVTLVDVQDSIHPMLLFVGIVSVTLV